MKIFASLLLLLGHDDVVQPSLFPLPNLRMGERSGRRLLGLDDGFGTPSKQDVDFLIRVADGRCFSFLVIKDGLRAVLGRARASVNRGEELKGRG